MEFLPTVPISNRLQALCGQRPVLCDGAMGTMFYDRGIFLNRCYDELNLSEPGLVRSIHEEYLLAGATLLETNTFGANRFRLQRFGLADSLAAINEAGVRLAREAAAQLEDKRAERAWVAASVGPLGVTFGALGADSPEQASPEQVLAAYAEQIAALAGETPERGPDLLILETMPSLAEAELALAAAREAAPHLPVAVLFTVDDRGLCLDGMDPEQAAARLAGLHADALGVNCSTGPAAVLAAVQAMAAGTSLPLFAMPNAGMPRAVDGRTLYLSSPEYLAGYARKFLKAGVQFVGGCCGTTPAHTRAMRATLRAQGVQQASGQQARSTATQGQPTAPAPLALRSRLGRLIAEGTFVAMVEIVPPRGTDVTRELAGARLLAAHGVDCINVPDSPRASARMSAQSLCLQIQQHVAIETLIHCTCRDRNLLSLQSDLLGASSLALKNVLCLTGDPPKLGNYPDATAVFDVDAIGLTRIVQGLNHGLDIGGNALGVSTGFTVAVAANPGVADIEGEIRRFAAKVEAGAEYAVTQPVFDLRLLEVFLRRVEGFRIPVIAGIWPLTSLRNAEFMRNDLKVAVPDGIMARMARAEEAAQAAISRDSSSAPQDVKAASRAEGIRIAQEMLATARPMVQGVAASAPFGRYETALESLASVLADRAPAAVAG